MQNQEIVQTIIIFIKIGIIWSILWTYLYVRAHMTFEKMYSTKDKTGWQWQQFIKHRKHGASFSAFVKISYTLLKIAILALLMGIVIFYQV